MSASLNFYLLDLVSLGKKLGPGNKELADAIVENQSELLDCFDEDDVDEEEFRLPPEVIHDLIIGKDVSGDAALPKLFAIHALLRELGEYITTEGFQEFHSGYLNLVDEGLAAIGLRDLLSTKLLIDRGLPSGIPIDPNDLGKAGYLLPEETSIIAARIDRDTGVIHEVDGIDPMIASAIEELLELLLQASNNGKALISLE
jgi:hypothetical protein